MASTIRMIDATLGRLPQRDRHFQCSNGQITFHPVRDGPADYPPGMQVQDKGEVEPSRSGPHIADVTRPFPVRLICVEVPVQQVWCDVEGVVAVGRYFVFLRSFNSYAIFAQYSAKVSLFTMWRRRAKSSFDWI